VVTAITKAIAERPTTMSRTYTPEQSEAIELRGAAIALIAGAGSGKTTVLVERYLRLLNENVLPEQILVVTFTNEAANQLKERIVAKLDVHDERRPVVEHSAPIGTLHSFCYRILNQFGSAIGLPPVQGILTPFEMASSFNEHYAQWLECLPSATLRRLIHLMPPRDLRAYARTFYEERFSLRVSVPIIDPAGDDKDGQDLKMLWEALVPLTTTLEESFLARGLYSFDELEHYALKILQRSPETEKKLRATFRYLLVDEFQDTSRLQWSILKLLIGEQYPKLFIVGDPKQSIYRFRKAEVQLFSQIAEEIKTRGGSVLELTTNFRSHPALMDTINALSGPLFIQTEILFSPMQSGLERISIPPLNNIRYGAGPERSLVYKNEIQAVTNQVETLVSSGTCPRDIALLFRAGDRMLEYADALERRGIAVSTKKTALLFESYEVLDVVCFLKALARPLDDFKLSAFLRTPYGGFTYEGLRDICTRAGSSLFEKIRTDQTQLRWFVDLVESGETDTHTCLKFLFENTPIYWPPDWEALLQCLAPLERVGPTQIFEAVEKFECWQAEELSFQIVEQDREAVRLMTVHGAKGLEFPHVFLVDLLRQPPRRAPRIFCPPDQPPCVQFRSQKDSEVVTTFDRHQEENAQKELAESKRVLYVALTRAKHQLTICLPTEEKAIPKGSWGFLLKPIGGEHTT
jgi:ATP-dependent exoDNAse (exonuclease V) beta subunit